MLPRATGAASRAVHVTVLAFILITLVSGAGASTTAAVPGIGVIRLGESASIGSSNLPRYATVILAPHKYSYIPQIKSASPGTRVLVYKNPMSIVDCPNVDTCSAGVTLAQARAHDAAYPNDPWILRDAAGNPVRNPSYSYFWLGNVGSASYRQQWLANVANTKRLGWDGVDIDDVLAQVSGWSKGVYPKLYPSDAAWESAMAGFMAYVGPQLKARGMYVLANAYKYGAADGSDTAAWWRTVGPYLNGLMREYWVQNPNNVTQMYDTNPCCWTGNWLGWLSLADTAKSVGAHFFGLMRGSSTDTHMLQYGRASFLLVWDGGASSYMFMPSDAVDPWNPAWTTDIGTPLAPRYQVGVGWRRDYSAGTALVNPNASSAQAFNLGGSYLTPSGATVTSLTLQPVNGMVLTKASTSVSVPANTSAPTISGTAQQGQTLRASVGTWSGSPTSYAYQWRRCDSAGANCAGIAGATASSFTLTSVDVGKTIRVLVTATNSAGATSASSAATAVVMASPLSAPANTSLPTISGTAQQGQTLRASAGTWSGSPTSYAYQWLRCDSRGANCAWFNGATGTSYRLTGSAIGSTIRVVVTAANAGGSAAAASNPTAVVLKRRPK
jgi:Hypothetical glycosyl hydrolase family 15